MNVILKNATLEDLHLLIESRLEVMRVVWGLPEEADMTEFEEQTREYYETQLSSGGHTAYLVYDGEHFVGCGGISFYRVMPTCDNPSGRKAYVMNMYVRPDYRRHGIAYKLLNLLVQDAKNKGITFIALEASEAGKPLYSKYGFIPMKDEMLFQESNCNELGIKDV